MNKKVWWGNGRIEIRVFELKIWKLRFSIYRETKSPEEEK